MLSLISQVMGCIMLEVACRWKQKQVLPVMWLQPSKLFPQGTGITSSDKIYTVRASV